MIRRALDFGAPVTEPGGNAASSSSGQPARLGQLAAHGGDEVDEARVLLDHAQFGHGHAAGGADDPQVVADQVDDHHVLGVVLVEEVRLGAPGPLDRPGLDDPAVPAQEQLGRGRRDLHAVVREPDGARVRRRVPAREEGGEGVHIGARGYGRGQHAAEVGLIDLAGLDVRADAPHTVRVRGVVERRRPVHRRRSGPGAGPRRRHRFLAHVSEAGADEAAIEIGADGPEAGGVEGRGIAGDVAQIGRDAPAEAGQSREVVHTFESMADDDGPT